MATSEVLTEREQQGLEHSNRVLMDAWTAARGACGPARDGRSKRSSRSFERRCRTYPWRWSRAATVSTPIRCLHGGDNTNTASSRQALQLEPRKR